MNSVTYTTQQKFALATEACVDYGYDDIRFNENGSVDVSVNGAWKTAFTHEAATDFLNSSHGTNLTRTHESIIKLMSDINSPVSEDQFERDLEEAVASL